MSAIPPAAEHDPYAAMRNGNFRRYLSGNIMSILGWQMQTTAVLWEINERGLAVYDESRASFLLGLVGLVQIVPYLSLALVAGHVADRFDRRKVIAVAVGMMLLCSLSLAIISALAIGVWAIYVCLFVGGIARAFLQPAKASLLPQIVPREMFANAVTWNMGTFQLASVLGPALGGLLIALFRWPAIVYLGDVGATLWFLVMLSRIERPAPVVSQQTLTLQTLTAGIGFVWQNKVLLGVMALDMFAVLLGGATAWSRSMPSRSCCAGRQAWGPCKPRQRWGPSSCRCCWPIGRRSRMPAEPSCWPWPGSGYVWWPSVFRDRYPFPWLYSV